MLSYIPERYVLKNSNKISVASKKSLSSNTPTQYKLVVTLIKMNSTYFCFGCGVLVHYWEDAGLCYLTYCIRCFGWFCLDMILGMIHLFIHILICSYVHPFRVINDVKDMDGFRETMNLTKVDEFRNNSNKSGLSCAGSDQNENALLVKWFLSVHFCLSVHLFRD